MADGMSNITKDPAYDAAEAAFELAVRRVTEATTDLLGSLPPRKVPPKTVPPLRRLAAQRAG